MPHAQRSRSAPDLGRFVESLARWDRLGGPVAHRRFLPPESPRWAEPARPLPDPLPSVLERMGVERLYTHQAEALDLIRGGRDVAVVTPTASGKSLVFYLPTIEATLKEPGARALYLFPYKALEQDQLKNIRTLGRSLFSGVDLSCEIYDGDTPSAARRKIRAAPPDVLITNPDMLHLGILAYHSDWRLFLERLRYVVVDELHVYRGIFGSHLAHVLRRLWRICAHYGSRPQVIACSATVGNPDEFSASLTGRRLDIVSNSGTPRAGKHFLFVNPDVSPYTTATAIMGRAVEAGFRTIAFTKARKITELIHSWLVESYPRLKGRVAPYRAGYLPEERRRIEQRLFRGELEGVVTTSALELGIDVGGLDVCILVGYPGSIMSSWQRLGRVGRGARESLTVLVAQPDALDQYFMRNPGEFFDRPFEQAVVDPDNPSIAAPHLICAGAEVPFGPSRDCELYPDAEGLFEGLIRSGRLVRDASGESVFSLRRRPQRDISLRSGGESFAIVDANRGRSIGSIDGVRVFHECHEGAIYLHGGTQYKVEKLDTDEKRVEAVPCEVDYYTQAVGEKETEILETYRFAPAGSVRPRETGRPAEQVESPEPGESGKPGGPGESGRQPAPSDSFRPFGLGFGRLKVTVRLNAYERRRILGQDLLSRHPLEVPPIVFETVGFWIVVPEGIEPHVTRREMHFMGGLHAAEHSMISLFPLIALCDRSDIGGISYNRNAQIGGPAIFIYDGYPGGIGLAARVHDAIEDLLGQTAELLKGCPCEDGCPSCIHSPKCGSGNRPLDKQAARFTLDVLSGRQPVPEAMISDKPGVPRPSGVPELVTPGAEEGPEVEEEKVEGRVLFFDLETLRGASEVGGWGNIPAMGLALGVVHDSESGEYRSYKEEDAQGLVDDLLAADWVVGYNIDRFDIPVLAPYTADDLSRVKTFDMLTHIYERLGFRVKLGDLARVNLGEGKSADGLQSLEWVRQGRIDLVEKYCRKDVEITARLFHLGRERGYLLFDDARGGLARIPVQW